MLKSARTKIIHVVLNDFLNGKKYFLTNNALKFLHFQKLKSNKKGHSKILFCNKDSTSSVEKSVVIP